MQEQSAWEYIDAIVQHRIPPEHRARFYQPFVSLVSQRPLAEQDALIAAGQPVFRYRSQTARDEIALLRASGASSTQMAPTVLSADFIAEIVHRPGENPPIKYLVYKLDGTTEIADSVQVGGTVYHPPQTRLVDTQTLLLPTDVEEYGEQSMLFQELRHAIDGYLHVEDVQFRNIMAYYTMLSWIYDRFDVVPYLRFQGEYGTGKTRGLQVIGALSYRPIMAGGATTSAPIFRLVSAFRGTLVIDEADFSDSDMWTDMIKILNTGYMKGFPVLRMGKDARDKWDPEAFDCFGPKILSTRRRFSDQALESRCLSYTMPLTTVPVSIPYYLGEEFRTHMAALRNKLLLWRFRRFREVSADPRQRIEGLDPRLNQIVIPLLSCAEDERMREAVIKVARRYQASLKEDRRESIEGLVAFAMLERWRAARHRQQTAGEIILKEVGDQLRLEMGEHAKLPDTKRLGDIVRHTFGLTTKYRGGVVWVLLSETDARRIALRYALPFESFSREAVAATATNGTPPRQPLTD